MKNIFAITIAFALIITACNHTVETPGNNGSSTGTGGTGNGGTGGGTGSGGTGGTGGGTNNGMVCFETEVLPIFKSSCAKSGCHDPQSKQEGYVLDSYANIMKKGIKPFNPNNSKIYEAITENDDDDDRMPLPPNPRLSAAQIAIIKKWINEGAINTTNCGNACDSTVFSYSQGVRTILETNCYGCHNNATANAGINLTTHAGARSAALSGRLLGAITHANGFKPMPMGSNKLDDCNIAKVRQWVIAGAPNN